MAMDVKFYRAYQLSTDDRIAGPAAIIEADNDAAAIEHAEQLVDGHDIELWQGPRLIANLKSKHGAQAPQLAASSMMRSLSNRTVT
jgi:hypothetical protein